MNNGFRVTLLASVAIVGGLALLLRGGDFARSPESLTLYFASGVRRPVEEIIAEYQREYGPMFQTQSAGSGELVGSIKTSGRGDLFLAADISYLESLQAEAPGERRYVDQIFPVAFQKPVIVVRQGNPRQIRGLEDLSRQGVKVSLADPKVAAIGRVAQARLEPDVWDAIWQHKHVARANVNMVANDVAIGAADAGIVWDATASQYPELETIGAAEFDARANRIAIGVLTSSKAPERALHFARYLTASDRGLAIFQRHGYKPVEGKPWRAELGSETKHSDENAR